MFLPHPRVKVSIVGSLRDREVACSTSDRQGSNFESCVWRTVPSQSSHHPQEVLLAQIRLYVYKGGLKPDSFLSRGREIVAFLFYFIPINLPIWSIKQRIFQNVPLQNLTYKDGPRTERVNSPSFNYCSNYYRVWFKWIGCCRRYLLNVWLNINLGTFTIGLGLQPPTVYPPPPTSHPCQLCFNLDMSKTWNEMLTAKI